MEPDDARRIGRGTESGTHDDEAGADDQSTATGDEGASVRAPAAAECALNLLSTVGSPVAIATGLLFYFGWVRTKVQAERLGYDSALLDLSIQDYILKSINVLALPLIALLLLAFALHVVHRRFVVPAVDRLREGLSSTPPAVRLLAASWLLWLPLGVLVAVLIPAGRGYVIPGILTATTLCALYAWTLREHTGASADPGSVRTFVLVILAVAVFWDTERLARTMGRGLRAADRRQPSGPRRGDRL